MLLTQNYPIIESLLFSAPVRSCPSALIVIACRIPPVKTHWRTSPFTFAPRWHLLTLWASNHLSWCNYPMQRIKALYEPKNALEFRPPFSWPCGNGFRSCHAVQIPRTEENPLTFSTHWRTSARASIVLHATVTTLKSWIMAQQKDTLLSAFSVSSLGCPSPVDD